MYVFELGTADNTQHTPAWWWWCCDVFAISYVIKYGLLTYCLFYLLGRSRQTFICRLILRLDNNNNNNRDLYCTIYYFSRANIYGVLYLDNQETGL